MEASTADAIAAATTPDAPSGPAFTLELNQDQKDIREWVHGFAANVMRPAASEWDEKEATPWPVIQEAAKIGLYSFEGLAQFFADPTGLTMPIVNEELFWGDAGIGMAIMGTGLAVAAIVGQGTGEQIGQWVPRCFGTADDVKVAGDVRAVLLADSVRVSGLVDRRTDTRIDEDVQVAALDVLEHFVGEQQNRRELLDVDLGLPELSAGDGLRGAFLDRAGRRGAKPRRELRLAGARRALVARESDRPGLFEDAVDENVALLRGEQVAAGSVRCAGQRDLISHLVLLGISPARPTVVG
jgi:hypothetical protein